MATKINDVILQWQPRVNRFYAEVQVQIFVTQDERKIIILTEHPDNPGMSVTNGIERIAELVCQAHGFHSQDVTWIEHYIRTGLEIDTFDFVTFRGNGIYNITGAEWKRGSWTAVAKLLGVDEEWNAL